MLVSCFIINYVQQANVYAFVGAICVTFSKIRTFKEFFMLYILLYHSAAEFSNPIRQTIDSYLKIAAHFQGFVWQMLNNIWYKRT